jgi:uncharacterized repeat protein (TIGR02543 family)
MEKLTLGNKVESIGDAAFAHCKALKRVSFSGELTTIGDYAFYKCSALLIVNFNEGLEEIGAYAFYDAEKLMTTSLPNTVKGVGRYPFKGCNDVTTLLLHDGIERLGEHAFYGCAEATVYVEADTLLPLWNKTWNSSYRPTVWGCTFSENNEYVVSIAVAEGSIQNGWVEGGFAAPERKGHTFGGWATSLDGEKAYEANEIANAPAGTTLYALWIKD